MKTKAKTHKAKTHKAKTHKAKTHKAMLVAATILLGTAVLTATKTGHADDAAVGQARLEVGAQLYLAANYHSITGGHFTLPEGFSNWTAEQRAQGFCDAMQKHNPVDGDCVGYVMSQYQTPAVQGVIGQGINLTWR